MIIKEGQVWVTTKGSVMCIMKMLPFNRVEVKMTNTDFDMSTQTMHTPTIHSIKEAIKSIGYRLDVLKTANNIKDSND